MIKFLKPYFHLYRRDMFLGVLSSFLETSFELALPFLMAKILDIGIQNQDIPYITRMGVWMVLSSVMAILMGVLTARFFAKAGQGIGEQIRQDEYEKIQGYSFANLGEIHTSSLITRLTNDVSNIERIISVGGRMSIRAPLMIICAFFLAATMNLRLTSVFAIAIPVVFLFVGFLLSRLKPAFDRLQISTDNLNLIIQENLIGARVVKSFVRKDEEIKKFNVKSKNFYENNIRAYNYFVLAGPVFQIIIYTSMLSILWIGSQMVQKKLIHIGVISGFITYLNQIMISLMILTFLVVMLSRSITSIARVGEVLALESSIQNPENGVQELRDGSIEFKHVHFGYVSDEDKEVLRDINFKIPSGSMVGIIGGTGSGKTSLVQLIPRLYDSTQGEVLVGGVNVKDYDLTVLRDGIGMVLQQNRLFSGSIKDNLRLGNEQASEEEIAWGAKIACADEFIQSFPSQYDYDLGQGGGNVSGGQRQRLCIARAIIKKPKILILDDSTSAVDMATDQKIRTALGTQLPKITKLVIAQRIHSVKDADIIIVIDRGEIVGMGQHEDLLSSCAAYQEIYETQEKIGGKDV